MSFKNPYLKLLILLFLIFVSIGAIVFLIKNTMRYCADYLKGESEFYTLQNKIKTFYEQQNAFEKSQPKISLISSAFLNKDQLVVFLRQLEELGVKNNIVFEIKSIDAPTKEKPYFIFQLVIKGKFADFLRFLFALENNPFTEYRLIEVQKINIKRIVTGSTQGGSPQQSSIESEIEIKVHAKL